MSVSVLLVVLLGAFLHASWNLLVKAAQDTRLATAGVYIGGGLIAAAALPFLPAPAPASWPYIAAAAATFRHLPGRPLYTLAQHVAGDELDILVYPELGMHADTFTLAGLLSINAGELVCRL